MRYDVFQISSPPLTKLSQYIFTALGYNIASDYSEEFYCSVFLLEYIFSAIA